MPAPLAPQASTSAAMSNHLASVPSSRIPSESNSVASSSPSLRRSPSPSESALVISPNLDQTVRNGRSYYRNPPPNPMPYNQHRGSTSQREAIVHLSHYLQFNFLPSVQPAQQEYIEKEATRQILERLANTVLPGAVLKAFGSTANGLSLRNSDMDLCCIVPRGQGPSKSPSELVEALGTVILKETNYQVKMLPRARIPIIKLTIPPTPESPFGMACDIGFDNMLALENTRLLWTYAMLEPRLRTMVLFIKVWTKRRKINSPYLGTLSSYGYALLVIFYLIHVRRPPLLPNLQLLPPTAPNSEGKQHAQIDGHNIYFYDDLEALQRTWIPMRGTAVETVGELLIGFFLYFSKEFPYGSSVISIRSENGLLTKESKGWRSDVELDSESAFGPRDLNRFCIEDPFQRNYNVARTVTKDGLFTIRGELMRAVRILQGTSRTGIGSVIAELCEEREEGLVPCPPGNGDRRRSAPSPRMVPVGSLQTALDFRQWAQANLDPRMASMRPNNNSFAAPSMVNNEDSLEHLASLSPLPPARTHLPYFQRPPGQTVRVGNYGSQGRTKYTNHSGHTSPSLERRLSWDGSAGSTDVRQYFQSNIDTSQSLTAPASPNFLSNSRGLAALNSHYGRSPPLPQQAPRSPTLNEPEPSKNVANGVVESRKGNVIRFGSFGLNSIGARSNVNGLGLFEDADTTVNMVEERRRPGMSRIDSNRDIILFGDVRVVRRASSSDDGYERPSRPLSRRTSLPGVREINDAEPVHLTNTSAPLSEATNIQTTAGEQLTHRLAKVDLATDQRTSLIPSSL